MKFQEASRFVRGRAGRQDIIQEKKRSTRDLCGMAEFESPKDIDFTFPLTEGSLARNRATFDQKGSPDGWREPGGEYRCEDLRLVKVPFQELEAIDGDGKDGVIPKVGSDGLCKSGDAFLTGLKQIIFPSVFNAVQ